MLLNHETCSTVGQKHVSKPFEYRENNLDSDELKSGNGIMKENQKGVLCDLLGKEGDADKLPCAMNDGDDWTASKLDSSVHVIDLTNDNEKEDTDYVASYSHSSRKKDSFEKDSVFYMDKSVMECELPELIVCYKENTYNVVKDICIDEGVPTRDKFLFDNGVDAKDVCNFLFPEKDWSWGHMKENMEIDEPVQDVLKLPTESGSDKHIANQCDPKDLVLTREGKDDTIANVAKMDIDMAMQDVLKCATESDSDKHIASQCDSKDLMVTGEVKDGAMDKIVNDVSREVFMLGGIVSIPELNMERPDSKPSNNSSNELQEQSSKSLSGNAILVSSAVTVEESNSGNPEPFLMSSALVAAAEESNKGSQGMNLVSSDLVLAGEEQNSGSDNTNLVRPGLVSTTEESTNSVLVSEAAYNRKVETRSITFYFDSRALASSGRKEDPQNLDCANLESKNTCRLENSNGQPVSSQVQNGIGETSFSAAGPVSGLISYSGPIAFSGSLSLRSDSSTTSTRSFAFPVLQSEWNSSPVRMAKAERRHLRKHSGWRQGFLCCRF